MRRDVYVSCEANGPAGAEKAADRHRPGGDMYRPGNRVRVEHGYIPMCASANPLSPTYCKSEPGYRIIVENDM